MVCNTCIKDRKAQLLYPGNAKSAFMYVRVHDEQQQHAFVLEMAAAALTLASLCPNVMLVHAR